MRWKSSAWSAFFCRRFLQLPAGNDAKVGRLPTEALSLGLPESPRIARQGPRFGCVPLCMYVCGTRCGVCCSSRYPPEYSTKQVTASSASLSRWGVGGSYLPRQGGRDCKTETRMAQTSQSNRNKPVKSLLYYDSRHLGDCFFLLILTLHFGCHSILRAQQVPT